MRLRPALAVAASCLLVAAPASALSVTGYVEADGPSDAALIAGSARAVTDFGIDGASVNPDGATVRMSDQATADLAAAKAAGRPASLLVSNYDSDLQDFSPALGSKVLDDPGRRAAIIEALRQQVVNAGWDGITVDFESLDPGDREAFTAIVTQLRGALPEGTALDVDVPAGTDPDDPYLKPFDLPGLAAQVDHVTLMAYDQHYIGGKAGPVAGLQWFKSVVAAATAQIKPAQLRIGIAGYGYRWRPHKRTVSITDKQARHLAGGRAHWSARQGEWTARLRDGSILWWSDRRSIAQRTTFATAAGAQGIAVWELHSADALPPLQVGTPTPVPDPTPTPVCPTTAATSSTAAARSVFCPLTTTAACPCPGPVRTPA